MAAEILRNGAIVLKSKDDVVLAVWPDKAHPFVTWRRDCNTPGEVDTGHYFPEFDDAFADFNKRVAS